MAKRCVAHNCVSLVIGKIPTGLVAYSTATLILAAPLLNSMGAQITSSVSLAGLTLSWTSLVIGLIWLLSGAFVTSERYETFLACFLSAAGMPGLLVGLLALAK